MHCVLPTVELLYATPNPAALITAAARQTMHQDVSVTDNANEKLIEFLYKAGHRTVLEHAVATVRITNATRAFMAQFRTHRHLSFTCSSQHYQDYRDYPISTFVPYGPCGTIDSEVRKHFEACMELYKKLIDRGEKKELARLVLPEAMGVNMIVTGNARAWAESLNRRLCFRNAHETEYIAELIHGVLMEWFPELFKYARRSCEEDRCREGHMSCGRHDETSFVE